MTSHAVKRYFADTLSGAQNCRNFVDIVTDYLEGTLTMSDWLRSRSHLWLCVGCRRYLRQMRQTLRMLGHLRHEPVPIAVRNELIERFRTWKDGRPYSS
jgi:hypothetical protein